MTRILTLLALSALTLLANVTGKWSFDVEGKRAFFIFNQDGSSLTGSVISLDGKHRLPMQNGTVEGNRLKFQVVQNESKTLYFDVTVTGDEINGEMQIDNDGKVIEVTLKKVADQ